jgi:hypothetical protein
MLAFAPWFSEQIAPKLATTYAMAYVHLQVRRTTVPIRGNLHSLVSHLTEVEDGLNDASRTDDPAERELRRELDLIGARITSRVEFKPKFEGTAPSRPRASLNRWQSMCRAANYDQFLCVGHSWFAIMAGVVGGEIASRFHSRRNRDRLEMPA